MKIINNAILLKQYIKEAKLDSMLSKELQPYMQLLYFKAKEFVYRQEDQLDGLYVFLSGEWKVCYLLENGKDAVFRILRRPRMVGEMEFILKAPASTTVQVTVPGYAIYLPMGECRELLMSDILFLRNISYNMAEALFIENKNASINQFCSPKSRMASFILSIQQEDKFTFNYKVLPGLLGMSDRHMFRILNDFIREGIIEKREEYYWILEEDTLEDVSSEAYLCDQYGE